MDLGSECFSILRSSMVGEGGHSPAVETLEPSEGMGRQELDRLSVRRGVRESLDIFPNGECLLEPLLYVEIFHRQSRALPHLKTTQ